MNKFAINIKIIMKIILLFVISLMISCGESGLEAPTQEEVITLRIITKMAKNSPRSEIVKFNGTGDGPERYSMDMDAELKNKLGLNERHEVQIFFKKNSAIGVYMGKNSRNGFISIIEGFSPDDLGIEDKFLHPTEYKDIYIFKYR